MKLKFSNIQIEKQIRNTQMTQQEKIKVLMEKFEEIKAIFPEKHCNIDLHGIDMNKLPDGWVAETKATKDGITFTTARLGGSFIGSTVTLFS